MKGCQLTTLRDYNYLVQRVNANQLADRRYLNLRRPISSRNPSRSLPDCESHVEQSVSSVADFAQLAELHAVLLNRHVSYRIANLVASCDFCQTRQRHARSRRLPVQSPLPRRFRRPAGCRITDSVRDKTTALPGPPG